MQAFVDFLVDNYFWFLIISLVLVFALIGYLVDTSEKFEKPKKQKVKERAPMEENLSVQNQSQNEFQTNTMETVNPIVSDPKEDIEILDLK